MFKKKLLNEYNRNRLYHSRQEVTSLICLTPMAFDTMTQSIVKLNEHNVYSSSIQSMVEKDDVQLVTDSEHTIPFILENDKEWSIEMQTSIGSSIS